MFLLPITLLACVAPATVDCPSDDHLELYGNDSCGLARQLSQAHGSHDRLSATSTSDDFYRLQMLPGSSLSASITFRHDDADLDLYLHSSPNRSCGSLLAGSYSVSSNESVQWTNHSSTSVEVILEVSWYSSAVGNSCAQYDLDWAILSGPCGDDIDEPNNSWMQASGNVPLLAVTRTIKDGDDDWYHMPICYSEQDTYARIEFDHAEGDIDIELWHRTGLDGTSRYAPIARSNSVQDFEEIRASAADDFDYYLRVYRYGGPGSCNEYTLTLIPNSRTPLGTTVCEGSNLPNLNMWGAYLTAEGSDVVSDNDFWLKGPLYPSGSVGTIVGGYGAYSVFSANPGDLCISNTKYFTAPDQIFATGSSAAPLSIQLDLNKFPANGMGPYSSVLPGDSWAFQLWYQIPQDSHPNYSDAVYVQFR